MPGINENPYVTGIFWKRYLHVLTTNIFDNMGKELTKETIGQVSGMASLLESEEVAETCCGIMNWDDSQPVGQAYLLMYSEDCEELKKGHVARLAR